MYKKIVAGTDGSETAGEAVRQAVELAKSLGATVHLVTGLEPRFDDPLPVGDDAAKETAADRIVREAAKKVADAGVTVETHSKIGDGASAITDLAEEIGADLIVVGNRGVSSPKRFLLGSVPTKVAQYAPCSVLIVRTT
ncbi:MAG: universal stress protein [Acidimicrobiia bacterium]|nr:universal stress protein [Acidimicrobiia bacterium]